PGSGTTLTFSVKNNNPAACNAATYNLTTQSPSGWTALLGTQTLLIPSGGTMTTTYTVTSSANAFTGSYTVLARATQANAATNPALASAVVPVQQGAPACTVAPPSVSLVPNSSSPIAPGANAGFTVQVTNNNGSSCSAKTFNFTPTAPTGWVVSMSSSLSL